MPHPPGGRESAAVETNAEERAQAARAHLSAWLGFLPLFGVFVAVTIYSRSVKLSPWAAQQALQSSLFQFFAFNCLLIVLAIVAPVSALAWDARYAGASLVLAVFLTALPFLLAYYLLQGLLATRAARAVLRGEQFRYPFAGRLGGAPAATAAEQRRRQDAAGRQL
ncbi:MAG: DUF4870 domain-containing protein [Dehalococcoidia bacterium]